jgi:predicted  nucleic acid-binding Zn-ribbon protein
MYQKIIDMELQELEIKVASIQNQLVDDYGMLDEFWQYHPANPDFINPIKAYDDLKKSILQLELKLDDLESKINHLKSTN